MAYSSISNTLSDGLNNKLTLDPAEQASAANELYQTKRKQFHQDQAEKKDQFYENISSLSNADQAERVAAGQGNSIRSILNNVRAVPSKLKEAKQASDETTGRLGMESGGLSSVQINDPVARQEKFGSKAGSMQSLMGDLYNRAKQEKKKQNALGKIASQSINAGESAISMATSELLQKSWLNAIDSYGLTVLLYVNFHVFCRFVFGPKVFCKLGHEWTGGKSGGATKSAGAAKSVSSAKGASSSGPGGAITSFFGLPLAAIGLAEAALLALVDAIVLFSLLIQLVPWVIIILIASGNKEMIWTFFGAIWETFSKIVF